MERLPIQAGNWDQLLHFLGKSHSADGSLAPTPAGTGAKASGATGDGATDDSALINNLIATANAAGGGRVVLEAPYTFAVANTITLMNNVLLELQYGATIKWTGSGSGTMFTGGSAAPLLRSGVIGAGRVDPNAMTGSVFALHSPQFCIVRDFEILSAAITSTVFAITTDASATTGGYQGTKGAVFNVFRNIVVNQTGNLFKLTGSSSDKVTLNEFGDVVCLACAVRGIDFVTYCDNNHFTGYWDVQLSANNACGVFFNSADTSPAGTSTVYSNVFDYLAIDAFTVLTGRVDVHFGKSNNNVIKYLHVVPSAAGEGGIVVDDAADSYSITARVDTSGYVEEWNKAVKHRTVSGGHYNLPDSTYPIRVFTSGDVEAFNVKGSDGTVTCVGPIVQKAGIYASDATSKLIDTTRKTGWTAATGTPTRTTFATGSVTLSVLAEHVKALIDDLIAHGLIGT